MSDDPYATGFRMSRRDVLIVGAAVGLAGCGGEDPATERPSDSQTAPPTASPTDSPTASPTEEPTPPKSEPTTQLVDPDLTVIDSGFVDRSAGLQQFFRIRVRNDLSNQTMQTVGVTVDFYDQDLAYLEQQSATIGYLGPREVFEGFMSYMADDAVAYVVRADRTDRTASQQSLSGITVDDATLSDESITGVVTNDGPTSIDRLSIRGGFFDSSGDRLGVAITSVTALAPGDSARFQLSLDQPIPDPSVSVSEFAVSVGDFSDRVLSVR